MRETLELGCEPPCKADRVLTCNFAPQRIADTNTPLHSTSPTTPSLPPHLPFSRATGRVGEGIFSKAPLHPLHASHRYCNPPPRLLSSPFSPSCPPLSSRPSQIHPASAPRAEFALEIRRQLHYAVYCTAAIVPESDGEVLDSGFRMR